MGLSGPVPGHVQEVSSTTCFNTQALKIESCTRPLQHQLADLEGKLQALWDLDTLGIKEGENSVYEKFKKSASFHNGCYCIHLPWKMPRLMLPENFDLSQKRLFNLLRRLCQTPHILAQYDLIIQVQICVGIVEVVDPLHEGPIGATHYTPHHAVM